jgi:hypothetical protein
MNGGFDFQILRSQHKSHSDERNGEQSPSAVPHLPWGSDAHTPPSDRRQSGRGGLAVHGLDADPIRSPPIEFVAPTNAAAVARITFRGVQRVTIACEELMRAREIRTTTNGKTRPSSCVLLDSLH